MATINELIAEIRAEIKENGRQEITGPVLQQVLLDMVYVFRDSTPSFDSSTMWQLLGADTTEQINVSHLSATDVAGMLTQAGYKLTDTTYGLATDAVAGLLKTGYAENGKNYAVKLDDTGKAYVNVPWTDKFDTYFGVDEDGNIYVKDNRGFWSNSFISARGSDPGAGSGGSGGGLDVQAMWYALGQPTGEQINASHIPSLSISKITGLQAALNSKLESITKAMVEGVLTGTITSHNHDGRYAPLSGGLVPSQYLPSYVDDVVEYASLSAFPASGEGGKIYVALDTNLTYRWGGTSYVEISPSLALGHTSSTAYPGDEGAANASAIQTLQGYFSGGAAKRVEHALTLSFADGAPAVYDGSAAVKVTVPTAAQMTLWDRISALFDIDADGNVYVKDNRGFWSNSFISARGSDPEAGSGGSGGGLDVQAMWYALGQPTNEKINVSHIPAIGMDKVSGLADALAGYLPLAGGAMSGNINLLGANSSTLRVQMTNDDANYRRGIAWESTNHTLIAEIGYKNFGQLIYLNPISSEVTDVWSDAVGKYSLVISKDLLTYNTYPILHSGNYTSYTVTKTGGGASGKWPISVSGTAGKVENALTINNDGGSSSSSAKTYNGSAAVTINIPTTLPASDVYSWAKQPVKPSYTFSEIGSKPSTLSGYGITDGVNAAKATGHLNASVSGHTLSIGVASGYTIPTASQITLWDKICALFDVDTEGNVYVTGSKGFWSNSFISARGSDPGAGSGGGSGVNMESVWYALGQPTTEKINVSHIPALQQLSGTLTNAQLANSSLSVAGVTVALGGAVSTAQIASALTGSGYKLTDNDTTYTLTKSGSTITLTGSNGSKTSVTDSNTTYTLGSFGITATAAEINRLDGITASTAELNFVDGVTSNIQTQLNAKANASALAAYALKDGSNASGTWGINISGIAYRAAYLTSTYTGSGGLQPPSYFNGMGLKVNMMNKPVSYCDVIFVNGYGGQGSDVPYVNALAFQKTANAHGEVYHARGDYGGSSWGTWYKFLDSYNYTSYTLNRHAIVSTIGVSGTDLVGWTYNGVARSRVTQAQLRTMLGLGSNAYTSTAYLPLASYTAADVLAKLKTVDGSGSGLDADLLDGYQATGLSRLLSYISSGTKTAAGWYRVFTASSDRTNVLGVNIILHLARSYYHTDNEAYTFCISVAYNNQVDITQVSGLANTRLITKIRVVSVNSGALYVDFYLSQSTNGNIYYITGSGPGTFQEAAAVSAPVGNVTEFTTVNGCKSSGGFTGALSGNASSATKLATARSIWGQTFDGTQGVDGHLYLGSPTYRLYFGTSGVTSYLTGEDSGYFSIKSANNTAVAATLLRINLSNGVVSGSGISLSSHLAVSGAEGRGITYTGNHIRLKAATGGWSIGIEPYHNDDTTSFSHSVGGAFGGNANTINYTYYGGTYNSPAMVILPNKMVGIGRTDPWYTLDVNGTIRAGVGIWSNGYVSAKGQDTTSDARYKRDVAALPAQAALAVLMRLRPSTWAWKDDGRRGAGFVAQEVMGVLPEAVREVGNGEDRHLALNYQMLHAYEVSALQTHETELERLRGRVNQLENEIKRIQHGS